LWAARYQLLELIGESFLSPSIVCLACSVVNWEMERPLPGVDFRVSESFNASGHCVTQLSLLSVEMMPVAEGRKSSGRVGELLPWVPAATLRNQLLENSPSDFAALPHAVTDWT
jgi:hypothetical protein